MKKIIVLALLTFMLLGMTDRLTSVPAKYYYFCSSNPTKWNTAEKKMIAYTDIKEGVFDEAKRDLTLATAWTKLVNIESIGFGGDTAKLAEWTKMPYSSNVNFYKTPEEAQVQIDNFLKMYEGKKYAVKKLELK